MDNEDKDRLSHTHKKKKTVEVQIDSIIII
jgi:hypothetical protein